MLASENSAKFAMAGDTESWLGLFADDAFLADPVGKSPVDPEGKGHRGKASIERFWDNVIGKANLTIVASQRIAWTTPALRIAGTNDLGGGLETLVEWSASTK